MDTGKLPPKKTERDSSLARQRSRSSSRGSERRASERDARRLPKDASPAARADTAPPQAGPAPREAPPPRTPAATSWGEPPLTTTTHRTAEPPAHSGPLAVTPQRTQQGAAAAHTAAAHSAVPVQVQTLQPPLRAKRPVGSPKSNLESDFIIVNRLMKANLISEDLVKTIVSSLENRQRLLDQAGASTPDEEEMTAARSYAATTHVPEGAPTAALKRQRTETDMKLSDTATKLQRVAALDDPLPQRERDPRIRRTPATTSGVVEMDTTQSSQPPPPATADLRPPTSFADTAKTPRRPADTATTSGASQPASGPPPPKSTTGPKKPRYPPLIVESMPNWATHLRQLKSKLGRTPSARPFGKGIKFTPEDDQEYRLIQRYLTEMEKEENISWFSYSLPQDRSLKVAIRGIPVDTNPDDISDELRTLGFEPEVVRPIRARQGRPGCIFFAVLKRTPDLIPAIYEVTELLCMPGVHIEAWRGKKGPAQCHRCQKFRHSSHNCHRKQACVRCGEEHSAHNCPRPREEPATCANCGGPHPSNNLSCPVFRREARNKRAGTIATTTGTTREDPRPKRPPREEDKEGADRAPPTAQSSNIRTEANDPTPRGAIPKKKRKSRRSSRHRTDPTPTPAAPLPTKEGSKGKTDRSATVIETAIQLMAEVLLALRAGEDPINVIHRGMSDLLKLNG